jgi:hypothetical protein
MTGGTGGSDATHHLQVALRGGLEVLYTERKRSFFLMKYPTLGFCVFDARMCLGVWASRVLSFQS